MKGKETPVLREYGKQADTHWKEVMAPCGTLWRTQTSTGGAEHHQGIKAGLYGC